MAGKSAPKPKFEVTGLKQVCMVVPDLQKAMESMWGNFGIGPFQVYSYKPSDIIDGMYRGKPEKFAMAIARAPIAGGEIELIQPTVGKSTYADFLKTTPAGGVHHLGWHIVKDVPVTIKAMEAAGFPCITTGKTPRSQFAYFDTVKALGTILEAVWWDTSVAARPPERVYPPE